MAVSALLRRQIRQNNWRRPLTTPSDSGIHTPIVIVGAGPSGLFLSRLLDSYKTPCVVLEASPSLTSHPQAHFLNTRSMEILKHSLPAIYQRVRHEMPPVEEWKRFRFGHDMNNVLAQVIHPVDRPLQAHLDANGKLLPVDSSDTCTLPIETTRPLSPCSVGHLAQHTFCKILNEAEAPLATVHYGQPVVQVEHVQDDGLYRVVTSDGTVFVTPVVVAADGFHSTLRKLWNIPMDGQEGIQHLINVHIRANDDVNVVPPAMLYAIWNPQLVGMMVRHSPQEYILQIPYFPPYQTMERNFTLEQVQTMVEAAFGTAQGISIESIRPWTMSSLIARRYVSKNVGGVLVGDAAHVFPPAGGFGMNTGMQDVHNLAWRLSLWHKNGQEAEQLESLLSRYESERRPVAQRNAALSVRNYRRILELTKACYLNDEHPSLLVRLLDQMTLLPLSTRQTMFQNLLETATFPLSALKNPSNPHARLVTRNVRKILKQGGGLPLLFPKFELGFGYGEKPSENEEEWTQDSMGYAPQIKVGHLLPHVELQVMNYSKQDFSNLQIINNKVPNGGVHISSCDLPAQLRIDGPCFVIVLLNGSEGEPPKLVCNALETVKSECGVPVASVAVVCTDKQPPTTFSSFDLIVEDVERTLSKMIDTDDGPAVIVLRPDGHVASVIPIADFQAQEPNLTNIITESITQTV